MVNRIISFILIGITTSFISCSDDIESQVLVDRIIYHEYFDHFGQLDYLPNGFLEKYEYYLNNKLDNYTEYHYAANKLVAKRLFVESISTNSFVPISTDTFMYSSVGILENLITDKGGDLEKTYLFTYDDGKIKRVDIRYTGLGKADAEFYEAEYDNRGNAKKISYYKVLDDGPLLRYIREYKYDTKVNPLSSFAQPYDLVLRSPNNVLTETNKLTSGSEPFVLTDVEYVYNEFDLPGEKVTITHIDNISSNKSKGKIYYKKF